jgi:hypothetical protein
MSEVPDSYDPDGYEADRDPYGPDPYAAANRTSLPGILLVVVGFLNLLGAGFYGFTGVMALSMTPEQFAKAQADNPFAGKQQLDPAQQKTMAAVFYLVMAAVSALAAVLIIAGGFGMHSLRLYGLALTGAILASLPCISPMGCCGFGEAIGIWALVVLLSSDVRSVFR